MWLIVKKKVFNSEKIIQKNVNINSQYIRKIVKYILKL